MKLSTAFFLLGIGILMLPAIVYSQPNKKASGEALNLNGTSNYIDIPETGSWEGSTEGTISMWVKPNGIGSQSGCLAASDDVGNNAGQSLWILGNNGKMRGQIAWNDGGDHFYGSTPLNNNQWYHVTLTWSESNAISRLYINGEIDSTSSTAVGAWGGGGQHFSVGGNYYDGSPKCFFDGIIDEVRFWHRPLSQSEVRELATQKLKGNESNLVLYWRFDAGTGGTAYDSSPNNNAATLK